MDDAKFEAACRKIGATPDDVRRLVTLAAQQNHVLVNGLRLGAFREYARHVCRAVARIEEEVYRPQGACSTRDAAMRGAQRVRDEIVLQGPVSPDARRRKIG